MTAICEDPLNLVIAGVGGQGNILLSRLIGRALVKKGYFVSVAETFGAAQRGGAVMSTMRISEKMSLGPLIPEGKVHIILSLEPLETLRILVKFKSPRVVTLTNVQPIPPLGALAMKDDYPDDDRLRNAIRELSESVLFLNATDMGLKLGAPIAANTIMLGALIASDLFPLTREEIEDEIREAFAPDRAQLNITAFRKGMESVANATFITRHS
jgi:indolepyruvate ferredoxin oxidoreductase beta subunit